MHQRLLVYIALCFLNTGTTSGELVAKNSGIQHIERQDVGMVFYVEIKNEGKQWYAINTRMIKCCETISPGDVECEHMQLVGGDMGILIPRASQNATLVWPTLYLHDRGGECMIAIGYTTKDNQTGEIRQKVTFDTSVSARNVRPILQGYYNTGDARKCSIVDLDTLDDCRPVNCHIKYNGKRNFFNRREQRCQAVPICIADTSKELPDVAYVPVSNTCRDLENAVNEVEVRALSQGIAEAAWRSEPLPYLSNVYCHHGSTDNATGFCICNDGWTSKSIDNLEPSTERIHLCNVQMLSWPRLRANRLKAVLTIMQQESNTCLLRNLGANCQQMKNIAALLGVLVVFSCCAMAYVMRGHLPPGDASERGHRTVASSCSPSSTRSHGTCCSSRPYKRVDQRSVNSDISCSTKKMGQY